MKKSQVALEVTLMYLKIYYQTFNSRLWVKDLDQIICVT